MDDFLNDFLSMPRDVGLSTALSPLTTGLFPNIPRHGRVQRRVAGLKKSRHRTLATYHYRQRPQTMRPCGPKMHRVGKSAWKVTSHADEDVLQNLFLFIASAAFSAFF